MKTQQNYCAIPDSASATFQTVATAPQAASPAFPRCASLTGYFETTLYPYLFSGKAPVFTPDELALILLDEFKKQLGVPNYTEWVWSYYAEVIYLFSLTGETQDCALLTLRGQVVGTALRASHAFQQTLLTSNQ